MSHSSSSASSTNTISFVERYLRGDFPTDCPPDQPSDLYFAPDKNPDYFPPAAQNPATQSSLQCVATSVQVFYRKHGFLPALKTLSGALESERGFAIQRYKLGDPSLSPLINRFARIANVLFKAPILVTLINTDTQFVLTSVDCAYKPREPLVYGDSLCSHTALRTDGTMLEIPDVQADWRFKNISGAPRYYAGQPLLLSAEDDGPAVPVGSFCVLSNTPRAPMTSEERGALADLTHLLATEVQRVFQESRQRKETLRSDFVSDLITNLSTIHSGPFTATKQDSSGESKTRRSPNPESQFRMLSATSDVRRMLDSDFVCLVDLTSLHLSWEGQSPPRRAVSRTVSRSKHGWVGHGQRRTSFPLGNQSSPLRIIDYSCSENCPDYSPEAVFCTPQAMCPLLTFLRTYGETSTPGYAHTGSDALLQSLLPPNSQAHIAIPLFNNAQPALLLLVSSQTPLRVYEPADVSFASTFAVLCLGSLAKIKLIKADAAKTAFVSMISHELRTPLHGLLSQLELIREFAPTEFTAETDTFLQTAEVCGLTLRDVLNDVLDFGKQENGAESQLHCTETDLSVLAIEVMSVAYGRRRQWESVTGESESAVEVHVAIEDSPTGWVALVDAGGLRRVLLNLASNALKYTPKGSIVLSLREIATPKPSDGPRVIEFSMKDTGIGMSSEYKGDIFTPFSQASTFNPGSGLGMSISEAIVTKLGGEIAVSSVLGMGTFVSFTLPVEFFQLRPARTPEDAPPAVTRTVISHDAGSPSRRLSPALSPPDTPTRATHAPPLISSTSPPAKPPDVRVLVVDDNAIGRKILTTLLARKGVPFREASDGLEALAVYRDFLPNLVWTDVSMPVMDGIESARQMRMIEKELDLRPAHIVALTGLSSRGEMQDALLGEAALDEWLVKGHANLATMTMCLEKVQRRLRRRGRGCSVSDSSASA
ncbi:hypothetical protein B0H15DRAFT_658420 [Mycena belliarum]|uniref:histidine kinase n=1 Tax=Mycena belliarum TaxID=1033014 RepID=A0AAD6XHI5_9AGAR|nr:hypothetical protein B0H15DRAFT_658420 [Mycena belliae]